MKKSLLRSFFCYAWYVLATLIILVAVLSASLKALTPVLNEYKPNIERYLSDAVGEKITIGSVNAHWERFGPQIDFKHVVMFCGDQALLTAGEVDFHIGLSWLDALSIRDVSVEIQEVSPDHYLINRLKLIELHPDQPLSPMWLAYLNAKQRVQLRNIHFSFDLLGDTSHLQGKLDAKLNVAAQQANAKAEIVLRDLLIQQKQASIPIRQLSASVRFHRDETAWFFEGRDIQLEDEQFTMSYRHTSEQNILSIEDLGLSSLLHWLKTWGIYTMDQSMDGQISSLQVTLPKGESDYHQYPFEVSLDEFYWPPDGARPGIDTLNVHAAGSLAKGHVEANAKKAWLAADHYFQQPVYIEKLYTEGAWQQVDSAHIDLKIDRMAALANRVNVSASLVLRLALEDPLQSWMSLVAGFQADHTSDLKASVPLRLFPESVQTWVTNAVGEGDGAEGTVIVRGRLHDFPYAQHQGVFLVDAQVKPFQLDYFPGWPSVNQLSSHLVFYHDSMLAKVASADILGTAISQASVRIPSFMHELHLVLTGSTDFPHVELVIEGHTWHIQADYLRLFGFPFHGLSIEGEKLAGYQSWRVQSQEANGTVMVPVDSTQAISGDMDKLILTTSEGTTPISVRAKQASSWPLLTLHIHEFVLNQQSYGDVFFASHPLQNGIAATRFDVTDGKTQLRLTGQWTTDHHGDNTHLTGTFRSENAKKWLARHHWAHLDIASAQANLDLSWNARPWAFSLASLNGHASLKAEDGIIPMDENASKMGLGKVLSLFSTQSLERRLRLDFSDLGSNGYSFNTLIAQLRFDDGDAYLTKTAFDGPQAKIDVLGRCGLATQDYDMELTITPYVTSTIPIIATIAGGPIIGAATYAMDKLFGSPIDQLSAYHYLLQGPWSQPVLTEKK